MTPGEAPEAIKKAVQESVRETNHKTCLLYTSDAADD